MSAGLVHVTVLNTPHYGPRPSAVRGRGLPDFSSQFGKVLIRSIKRISSFNLGLDRDLEQF
jgi:hypothetical protein